MNKKIEDKETNMNIEEEKEESYYLILKSADLPFVSIKSGLSSFEVSNSDLQIFVRFIEKKFDTLWYIGTDYIGDDLYERFMFQHGGFMEISLKGDMRCYFPENKIDKMKKAIFYSVAKMKSINSANRILTKIKAGKRLISLKDFLDKVE